MNASDFTITSIDGEVNYHLARNRFPVAKRLEMPGTTDPSFLIQSVLNNKADVTFLAAFMANDYMQKNPGKIKQLSKDPVVVFDTALMFRADDAVFAGILDAAIRQLHSENYINGLLNKYNVDPKETLRIAKPYQTPE